MNYFDNNKTFSWILSSVLLSLSPTLQAQALSFQAAEQSVLRSSYSSQAANALQQAAELKAESMKGLGLPRVDLNVRAYAFHHEIDLPLTQLKNNVENSISQGIHEQISQWESNQGLATGSTTSLQNGIENVVHNGIGLLPDRSNLVLDDQVIRPTVSITMPLYSAGLTQNAKQVANLEANRSRVNSQQQQDLQRLSLIQAYFNVQLQQQLQQSSEQNLIAMQQHYQNALKMEREGFISKGQRMQFEVAKNNAQIRAHNTMTNLQTALFNLNNLLQQQNITQLSTPLFVNQNTHQDVNVLLNTFKQNSALMQKLQLDTELAAVNVSAKQAAKKPTVFGFAEYSVDEKQSWIVGVAARYNLFSGIDEQKNIQAAELQRYATQLVSARSAQELETLIYTSYREALSAQQTDLLLRQNLVAAQENLRIQQLAFKEDVGTASQVIDAQNSLSTLKAETALNAYKYVMALASLLHSHGTLAHFSGYLNLPSTHYVR